MKKYVSAILTILIILSVFPFSAFAYTSVWDGSIADSFESGTGTYDNPYIIKTAEQLAYLAKDNNYKAYYVKLEADIILNDTTNWENWGTDDGGGNIIAPVNTWTPIRNFSGTFDGNGHTVSGIYINSTDDYQGLFGSCSGAIKNLGVVESFIHGDDYIGGVAGYGYVYNCYNGGAVSGDDYIGGVVGRGNANNCYNTGSVTGNDYTGGVAGDGEESTISNCYNTGSVNGNYYTGGVVGGSSAENCYNTGSVTGNDDTGGVVGDGNAENCYNIGSVTGNDDTGGVVGYGYANNCYNTGSVTGNYDTGGVVGGGNAENCYNIGSVAGNDDTGGVVGGGNAENCYNTGSVTGNDETGGVVGYGDADNCFYLDSSTFNPTNNKGTALSDSDMKLQNSYENWNFNKDWEIGYNSDYDYPTLKCFGSKIYVYEITFIDRGKIISNELFSDGDTFTVRNLSDEKYDFAYYEDYCQKKYYVGDEIVFTDDMAYTAYWTTRNESENVWNGSVDTVWEGDGTEDRPYLISSAAELAGLSELTQSGNYFDNKYFTLTADIILNDSGESFNYYITGRNIWAPIINFQGIFDGNGHTVSGLYLNSNNTRALFASCQNAEIKNLGLINSFIKLNSNYNLAGIVSYASNSTISHCFNESAIEGSGIVGELNNSVISYCYNTGNVSCGIVGSANYSIIFNCYNKGNVDESGIVGGLGNSELYNCFNSGTVESVSNASGIALSANYSSISNCYNTGSIRGGGYQYTAGIVSNSDDSKISDCYNIGTISGKTIGAITCDEYNTSINNCYFLNSCISEPTNTEGTALSDAEMKLQNSFINWNFNKTWEIGYDTDYDYPTLKCFGSKDIYYQIDYVDRDTILSSKLTHCTESFTVSALYDDKYDFAYYEDENGKRYYVGDTIIYNDDMTYTVAWATRNESENVWNGSVDTVWEGDGTKESPYLISSAAELAGLAERTDSEENFGFNNKYFILTTDIILNDGGDEFDYYITGKNFWTPINNFYGTFDGNEHTVSGIYINNSNDFQGLFGYCYGTIKNIGVVESFIHGKEMVGGIIANGKASGCNFGGKVSGTNYIGGIAGWSNNIENCSNTGMVNGNNDIGGIVGNSDTLTISYCYNTGSVTGNSGIGGIVGNGGMNSTISNCYNTGTVCGNDCTGGIVGYGYHSKISSCYNTGSVTGNKCTGGVVGYGYAENCYNTGSVTGNYYTGGVVGYSYNITISNCYNTGPVSGNNYIGGVVGQGSADNCYNIGSVTGNNYIGGVVGDGYVENCYYLDTGVDSSANTYGTKLTEAQMRLAESYVGFDFDKIWTIDGTSEYPYPTLTGNKTETTYTVTFLDKDSTVIDTQTVVKNKSATAPDMSNKAYIEGDYVYSFDRWDSSFTYVTGDITVKAIYKRTEIIKFLGSDSEINVSKGYSKDELRVTLDSYFSRKLFTTTNGYKMMCEVIWNESDFAKYNPNAVGTYKINGTIKITDEKYSEFSLYYSLADNQALTVTVNVLAAGTDTDTFDIGDIEYKIENNSVTVTGYKGNAKEITVPDKIGGLPVTKIADNAFCGNTDSEIVKLPDSITEIGDSAFYGCESLIQIYLNDSLKTIGKNAFAETSLICITIPSSVTSIGEKAIAYYDGNKTIDGFVIYAEQGSEGARYADENGISLSVIGVQTDSESGIEALCESGLTLAVASIDEGEYYENAKAITEVSEKVSLFEIKLENADNEEAQPGNIMTISIPIPEGFDIDKCKIYRINSDGSYKDMEAVIRNGKLVFTTAHLSYYAIVTVSNKPTVKKFNDVKDGTWYTSSVYYCVEKGYFSGTGNNNFSPNNVLTREQFIQVLFSFSGADKTMYSGNTGFTDVASGKWYSAAIKWAKDNNVTSGIGGGLFGLGNKITREQFACLLMSYSELMKKDTSRRADISAYKDVSEVSSWAKQGMAWAVAEGLISGTSATTLSPKKVANRATASVIFMNYDKYLAK